MLVLAALLAAAALLTACGGERSRTMTDPDKAALDAADDALIDAPDDPQVLGNVIRIAYRGASNRYDPDTGDYRPDARPFLNRAATVWPEYLEAAGADRSGMIAAVMVKVFGDGLGRPKDAAFAAQLSAATNPSAASYLQLVLWSARAGDKRAARLAGQKALELAEPADREEIREAIDRSLAEAP